MTRAPGWAREARERWQFSGARRPGFARAPGVGERSVWDFPRPPVIEALPAEVHVSASGVDIARSTRSLRVLETGGPPTCYVPAEDLLGEPLRPTPVRSRCEWKGEAHYWDVVAEGTMLPRAAWSYPEPFPEFAALRGFISFYPAQLECRVGGVLALAQPGGFYGGWVTPELVGPFKGEPGTEGL